MKKLIIGTGLSLVVVGGAVTAHAKEPLKDVKVEEGTKVKAKAMDLKLDDIKGEARDISKDPKIDGIKGETSSKAMGGIKAPTGCMTEAGAVDANCDGAAAAKQGKDMFLKLESIKGESSE